MIIVKIGYLVSALEPGFHDLSLSSRYQRAAGCFIGRARIRSDTTARAWPSLGADRRSYAHAALSDFRGIQPLVDCAR